MVEAYPVRERRSSRRPPDLRPGAPAPASADSTGMRVTRTVCQAPQEIRPGKADALIVAGMILELIQRKSNAPKSNDLIEFTREWR